MSRRVSCTVPAAVAAMLALFPQGASALDFKFNGPAAGGYRTILDGDRGSSTLDGTNAGAFSFTDMTPGGTLGNFVAWCFDLDTSFSSGSTYKYEIDATPLQPEPPYAPGALARVQKLFDKAYDLTIPTDRDKSAGFQIAIWEVLYDTGFDLNTGGFTVTSAGGSALSEAVGFLSGLDTWTGSQKWTLTLYDGEPSDPDAQDVGVAAAIPLPAAAWLLLGVSGALVAAKRRHSAAKG